jgi:hypothetical protein
MFVEGRLSGSGHERYVVGGDPRELFARRQRAAGVGPRQQVGQLRNGAHAHPRPRAFERAAQLLWQR